MEDAKSYLSLPCTKMEMEEKEAPSGKNPLGSFTPSKDSTKDSFQIATVICSTKLTQNGRAGAGALKCREKSEIFSSGRFLCGQRLPALILLPCAIELPEQIPECLCSPWKPFHTKIRSRLPLSNPTSFLARVEMSPGRGRGCAVSEL